MSLNLASMLRESAITYDLLAGEALKAAEAAGNVPAYVVTSPGADRTPDRAPDGARHFDELRPGFETCRSTPWTG